MGGAATGRLGQWRAVGRAAETLLCTSATNCVSHLACLPQALAHVRAYEMHLYAALPQLPCSSCPLPATGAAQRACGRDALKCSPASAPLSLLPIAGHRCCSTCLRTRSTARTSAACWRTSATPTGCVGCGCGCGLCAGGGALMLLCGGGDEADAVAAAACCLLLLSLLLLPNSRFLCMRANN